MNERDYREYCTGCGLCHSECNVNFNLNEKLFPVAALKEKDILFCKKVCPAGIGTDEYLKDSVWGSILEVHGGWASDNSLRHCASSGGVLTALAIWLLKTKQVDGIIQTRVSADSPIQTETSVSYYDEDVKCCVGSRYSISTPLYNLREQIVKGKRYAVIGRPCDILALKKYSVSTGEYKEEIVYTLSFFCAGTPSMNANIKLLKAMGCELEECKALSYRGNGWPGYATARDKQGNEYYMKYSDSWGKYLGRDIRPICRFCIDGTGAAADISCGDYWHLKDGMPDFGEHEGRNLIFCRNKKGCDLIERAYADGAIQLCDFSEGRENIQKVQPAQFERITTMYSRILAMKLFRRTVPEYNSKVLRRFAKENSMKKHLHIFAGTVKRIKNGKI